MTTETGGYNRLRPRENHVPGEDNRQKHQLMQTHSNSTRDRLFVAVFIALALIPVPLSPLLDLHRIQDRLWGAEVLREVYAAIRYRLGDRIFDLALRGKGDWLSYTGENSLDDYQNANPFSQDELVTLQRKLDSLNARLASRGAQLIVVIPPNKNTVYPEYMPAQIPKLRPESRLDQLVQFEKEHGGFSVLDLRPAFQAARGQESLYYADDTHWTPFGVYIAYQAIMSEVQKQHPNVQAHVPSDYAVVSTSEVRDLVTIDHLGLAIAPGGLALNPTFAQHVTTQSWNLTTSDATFFNGTNIPNITTSNADEALPRLLMLHDSFGPFLVPFLSDHFSRAVYLWAYPSNETFYTSERPDVVVLEYTERYLQFLFYIPG